MQKKRKSSSDPFGIEKARKSWRLARNKMRGNVAEGSFFIRRSAEGYEIHRTGRGSDYWERKIDRWTGKKGPRTYVDVKSGNAQLSKLQRKTSKKVKRYRTERS